jgi:hypothetical protein
MSRSRDCRFSVDNFEAGTIDPDLFDHEAHVYVAWLYLRTFERDEAIRRFDAALRRLTRKIGAASKYNAMITWLFLKLIAERALEDESWPEFRARNTDLFEGFPRAA